MILVTQTQNKENNNTNSNENVNTEEVIINENKKDKKILNKKVEKTIVFNEIISENLNEKNIQKSNNSQFNIFQKKNSNNNINCYPSNNIIIPNISQQNNDYTQLKYSTNLGINNTNSVSQISFVSLNNDLMTDLNNFLNNSFQKNNLSQLNCKFITHNI